MPVYDYFCDSCGFEDEVYIKLDDFESTFVECPYCVLNMRRIISPVATIGPMPSKPLVADSIGKKFEKVEDLRNYLKANPDLEMYSSNDAAWIKRKDNIRDKAEKQAKKQGYRDLDEMKAKKIEFSKKKSV